MAPWFTSAYPTLLLPLAGKSGRHVAWALTLCRSNYRLMRSPFPVSISLRSRRFRPPQRREKWEGVFDAVSHVLVLMSPACDTDTAPRHSALSLGPTLLTLYTQTLSPTLSNITGPRASLVEIFTDLPYRERPPRTASPSVCLCRRFLRPAGPLLFDLLWHGSTEVALSWAQAHMSLYRQIPFALLWFA